jgi:hypothetical protein
MLYALCSMLYALCSMLYALCSMLYAHAHTRPHTPLHTPTHAHTRPHTPTHAHTRPSPLQKFFDNFMALLTIFCGGFLDDFDVNFFTAFKTTLLTIFYGFLDIFYSLSIFLFEVCCVF